MKTRAVRALLIGVLVTVAATAFADTAPVFLLKWGSPGSGDGQFLTPIGICVDANGDVYVADTGNHRVQKFDGEGVFLAKWGTRGAGEGQFDGPMDVAVDVAGNIYVSDAANMRIEKFDSGLNFLGQWELPVGRGASRITLDPSGQYLYTAGGRYVVQYAVDGAFVREWDIGGDRWAAGQGIAVGPSGAVYVADNGDFLVRKFTATGVPVLTWGASGSENGQFAGPIGVAVDVDENVLVSDVSNRIQEFTATGEFLAVWGSSGSGDGQFARPNDVAVDGAGSLFVTDAGNCRVQKFGQTGTPVRSTTWGQLKARYR